jgi:hypothetical protein
VSSFSFQNAETLCPEQMRIKKFSKSYWTPKDEDKFPVAKLSYWVTQL